MGVLDQVAFTGANVGCSHLWNAVQRARPRLHVFGHIHEGWGAELWEWDGRAGAEKLTSPGQSEGKPAKSWDTAVDDDEKRRWVEQRARFVDLSGKVGEQEAQGRKIVHGESTLFVNPSIMDLMYRPVNAPWVVDLDLKT